MSKRLPAPPPPGTPPDARKLPIDPTIPDDDDLDPAFDIEDDGDELLEDFDQRDWPDDEPLTIDEADNDDLQVAPTEEIDFDDIDDEASEYDPTEDHVFSNVEPVEDDELDDEMAIVPWKSTANLPEHGAQITVILDVTSQKSAWVGGPGGATKIELAGLTLDVDLLAEEGPTAWIRLGRDAISGRLLVQP